MASLLNRRGKYYSRIRVRTSGKRLVVVVPLHLTENQKYKADKRNEQVTDRENKIRLAIRKGEAPLSDLLNINKITNWSWIKQNGKATSYKNVFVADAVGDFIDYCVNNNKRESTIQGYRYGLDRFVDAVNCPISDVSEYHIENFKKDLINRESVKSDVTINTNLKVVRTFLNWCVFKKMLDNCPQIRFLDVTSTPLWFTDVEVDLIFNYKNYTSSRFLKSYKMYYNTGLRLKEPFYGVVIEDEGEHYLRLSSEHSKGKTHRSIPISEQDRESILLMQGLWYEGGCRNDHIKYYSRYLRKICNELGIDKRKHLHSFRHSFGKRMVIMHSADYPKVAYLMGHHSFAVTEKYYAKSSDILDDKRDFPSLKKYLILDVKNKPNKLKGQPIRGNHIRARAYAN